MSEESALPTRLVLETASVCNLRCPGCYSNFPNVKRRDWFMTEPTFRKVFNQLRGSVKYVYLQLWGEPTLNRTLPKMIQIIHEAGMKMNIATNALCLTDDLEEDLALCDDIFVSIDGIGQEVYEKYRVGGHYERAIQRMKSLAERVPGKVAWIFVVFNHNEHQIDEAREMASKIGVRFEAKPPYFIDDEVQKTMAPTNPDFLRYTDDGTLKSDRLGCKEFWTTATILSDGNAVSCCFDYDGKWSLGNVHEKPFEDIWNGPGYKEMRRKHLSGQLNPLCEQRCMKMDR